MRLDPRPSPPSSGRPLVAALMSSLVPGAGQLYLGRRRRGVAMLLGGVAVVIACVLLWRNGRGMLTRVLTTPSWLLGLLAIDAVLLGLRVWCVVDAGRLGAGPATGPVRRGLLAGMAALVLFTAVPHSVAAFYDVQAYDLLTSVFGGGDDGSAALSEGRTGNHPVVPGRITVLLLGGDAGPGRIGLRTDTMIVVSVEPASGRAVLFGLPRNLMQVPLAPGPARSYFGGCCFPRPLNELYAFAQEERRDLFPSTRHPGIIAVRGAAEELLGIRIDHYALVDLRGFVDVINALGGVTVKVTDPVRVEVDQLKQNGGPAYTLQPGRHHLSGLVALAYVRQRKETSDYDRMRRQRCLLSSLAAETNAADLLRAFPRLARVLKRSVVTDIPVRELPTLLQAAAGKQARTTTVGFTPPAYVTGYTAGYPIPDVHRIQAVVRKLLLRGAGAPARAPAGSSKPSTPRPQTSSRLQGPDNCEQSARPQR
jgi:polyisoprenyl-teichoic acid--peptidoglycan teichoic acid transferase